MAHTARSAGRYAQLPIFFEDGETLVYTNGSGEIFVENKRDRNSTIRVTPDREGFHITAYSAQLTPWAVHGLPAIWVHPRR